MITDVYKKLISIRGMGQVLTVTAGLVILCIVFGALNPSFYSERNLENLFRQIAPILIIGIGQSFVLITGNIDLSIGSIVGMSGMISATLMTSGMNPLLAAVIAMVCCMMMGVINGSLVAKCKLPPFIATLGTMTVARGIAQIVNNNYNTDAIGEGASGFRDFFYYGQFLGLYNTIWIAIVLFLVFNFLLSKTRTGRHIYAVGSNIEAAKLSGVNTVKTTMFVYIVSAFCGGVVGLIICATAGMGTMDAGNMYEMYAVAASVIGGISTLGGQGLLFGVVIGASIWGVLQNGLQFAGAPVAMRNIIIGAIVVISVLLDVVIRTGKNPIKLSKNEAKKQAT
ncbi:ABC transporter permease [Robertmurraya massiliosenegalensis]|uniref:ABC transporter permease n=1 Tax=Robertmurraya TaxID=2837507 RepID=UPI0039A402BA